MTDDIALVIWHWTLKGHDADGNEIDTGGRYTDLARRHLAFVIDNPNCSD